MNRFIVVALTFVTGLSYAGQIHRHPSVWALQSPFEVADTNLPQKDWCVAFYKFTTGTGVQDAWTNHYNLSDQSCTWSNDFVHFKGNSMLTLPVASNVWNQWGNGTTVEVWTIAFWARMKILGDKGWVHFNDAQDADYGTVSLFSGTAGPAGTNLSCYIPLGVKPCDGGNVRVCDFDYSPYTGTWHHVGLVWAPRESFFRAYIDSTQVFYSASPQPGDAQKNVNANIYLGQYANGRYTDGDMDDFGLWRTNLTAAEITNLYLRGRSSTL